MVGPGLCRPIQNAMVGQIVRMRPSRSDIAGVVAGDAASMGPDLPTKKATPCKISVSGLAFYMLTLIIER